MPERRIFVGLDYDGVIIKKAPPYDLLRRPTKIWLPNSPDLQEGLQALYEVSDVNVLGIYTVRPRLFRGFQTREQMARRGIPIENVTHTANSSVKKIAALCQDALGDSEQDADNIRQIVLIDDSAKKVVHAAQQHARRHSPTAPLLPKFTLVAFNPKEQEDVRKLSIPEVINVIPMQGWDQMKVVIDEILEITA